jgi:hypothetical protein
MIRRDVLFAVASQVVLTSAAPIAPSQAHPSAMARLAGCYEVRLGSWSPSLAIGGDAVFMTPPAHIRLWRQLNPEWARDSAFAITPVAPSRDRAHKYGIYRIVSHDSIAATFSNGLSGVVLELGVRRDSLVGRATSFWDFPRQPQSATAVLVRRRCPTPEEGTPPARWNP